MILSLNIKEATYIKSVTGHDYEVIKGKKEGQYDFKFERLFEIKKAQKKYQEAQRYYRYGDKELLLNMLKEIKQEVKDEIYIRLKEAKKQDMEGNE